MGGQACVLYGGAEFSKDFDFLLLTTPANLVCFEDLLSEIKAERIAVPSFELSYLERGHAIHFRSQIEEFKNLRIDIMSKLRGLDDFNKLWSRRTTIELLPQLRAEVLSLHDLVQAKKTQRDKDWPMIRRLVDVDYLRNRNNASDYQIKFWMQELRSSLFLRECTSRWPAAATEVMPKRQKVLEAAILSEENAIEEALATEQALIRQIDKEYWKPLIKELEEMRHKK